MLEVAPTKKVQGAKGGRGRGGVAGQEEDKKERLRVSIRYESGHNGWRGSNVECACVPLECARAVPCVRPGQLQNSSVRTIYLHVTLPGSR